MKALQYDRYGGAETLRWNEVETPEPADRQILVQVKAASLNPTDSKIRQGILKFGPERFPKGMGMDFAGIVSKTGTGVSHLKTGDRVMGYMSAGSGSFADYLIAGAADVFPMPERLSYEEATTLPMSAATALTVVNNYVKPTGGKTILVNGASGGIGLFIVQYCKLEGAVVSGTAGNEESLGILKSLGVDEVIDYKKTNILQSGKTFDAVVDTSGKLDFDAAKILLKDTGEFSTMVPKSDPNKPGRTDGAKKENLVFAVPGPAEFEASQSLAAQGKIKPVVGKTFPMQDAVDAIKKFDAGELNAAGKVVLVAS